MNSSSTTLAQRRCSYCGATELILDRYTLVCSKCGTVVEEDYYDYRTSYVSNQSYELSFRKKKTTIIGSFSRYTIFYSIVKSFHDQGVKDLDELVKLLDTFSDIKQLQSLLKRPCFSTLLKRLAPCEKKVAIEILLDLINGDYFYPFILSQKCGTKREIARSITKKIYKCINRYE